MLFVTEVTIPFQPAADPATLEARLEARSAESLVNPNGDAAFALYCELAGLHWALGEPHAALETLQKALHWASQNNQLEPIGYLLCLQGAALCYIGQYAAAHELFAQAELIFRRGGDALGMAWQRHLMAREYQLDLGNFTNAQRQAAEATPIFRADNLWHAYAESLLAQANASIGIGDPRRATDLLKQVDGLITERNLVWSAPEYHWLRARAALAEGTPHLAAKHCYNGLNAISNGGDVRLLTPLYVTLGKALEADRNQHPAAQDAFERAVMTAQGRARSLHAAQAYWAAGQHLKRYSQRLTLRARGSGYLYEAERRYKALGLPMPEA